MCVCVCVCEAEREREGRGCRELFYVSVAGRACHGQEDKRKESWVGRQMITTDCLP